ncbi:MAG: hypothetical protein ACTHM7_16025 [Ginsengibacter sp.]
MKNKLLPILFFFYFGIVQGQQEPLQDSLGQYSYLVYGSTELSHPKNATIVRGQQATGFFIKKDNRLYFITAKHAVTNYVANGDSRNNYPDSFNVYAHYDDPFHFVSIPAIWSTATAALKGGLIDSDVFCYQVTHKLNGMHVRAIEFTEQGRSLVSSRNNYDKIRILGFPVQMNKIERNVIQITPPYRFETSNFKISESFLNRIGNDVGVDSVRYEIEIKDFKITSAFGGFSGAPVFIENKVTNKWELMGVLVGINPLRNAVYVTNKDKLRFL